MNAIDIGKNLIGLRNKKGISQEKLAAKVDKSKNSIYLLEKGQIKDPGILTLQKIADVLEVPITELLKK